MSFVFTIDGIVWRVTWKGITFHHEFYSEDAANQFLKDFI